MQVCEHGPRLDNPGDGDRGAFSPWPTYIHTYRSQPKTSLAAAVVDMWQKWPRVPLASVAWTIGVAVLRTRTKKQKGTLLVCFSGGKRVVLPCKRVSSACRVFTLVCTLYVCVTPRGIDLTSSCLNCYHYHCHYHFNRYYLLQYIIHTTALCKEASEWTGPAQAINPPSGEIRWTGLNRTGRMGLGSASLDLSNYLVGARAIIIRSVKRMRPAAAYEAMNGFLV